MKPKLILAVAGLMAITTPASLSATAILAQWTFETSPPTTPGPHVADGGVFATTSNASTNSGGTISNPAGNGSAESFSSNGWTVGEYYQFLGSSDGYDAAGEYTGITVSFAQAASGTGPGNFQFQYSLDGTTFVDFGSPYAGPTADFATGSVKPEVIVTFDLTSIPVLLDQATIGFRVVVADTVSENGGTIASTGTLRVDDFTVTAVPEPAAALLGAIGMLGLLRRRRDF